MNMNILAVDTTTYNTFDFLADGETEKELLMNDLSCRIPYGVILNVNGISNVTISLILK